MQFRKKTKSMFLAFLFAIGLVGCNDASIDPISTRTSSPKYLLNGTLHPDAPDGFAYYINGSEAYVARGQNTDTNPSIASTVTLGGKSYTVTGIYHSGFSKADIESISLPLTITTIDYQAFANAQLTSVVIPCNVAQMGSGAFMNCHSLEAVQFKNNESESSGTSGTCEAAGSQGGGTPSGSPHLQAIPDYCFFNCDNLKTVSFPTSLKTVESCGFSNCIGLTKLAFLAGFTTLKTFALESCKSLTDIYLPQTFTSAADAPANCEKHAFYGVKSKCSIHLSTASDTIYNTWKNNKDGWAFNKISGSDLAIPAREKTDVVSQNDYLYRVADGEATVFSYAPSTFPTNGVVVMPSVINDITPVTKAETSTYASYKTQIKQIYLSTKLKKIESNFFDGMTQLSLVSAAGSCYNIEDSAIDLSGMEQLKTVGGNLFNKATYMQGSFAGSLTLPTSLEEIENNAFKGLEKAKSISFVEGASSLTKIGNYAFQNFGWKRDANNYGDLLDEYFELSIPATCTEIGQEAFENVLGLKKIQFESDERQSLNIKTKAFAWCRSLCEIILPTEGEVTIQNQAFYCCSSGSTHGFLHISGIQEVFIPDNVTSIGSQAFAVNERACFFFEDENPSGVDPSFNLVFSEKTGKDPGAKENGIIGGADNFKNYNFVGIREHAGVYYGVGFDGESSTKKRLIMTDDFCFVETSAAENKRGNFICARYRYHPENLAANGRVTVRVPEYLAFTNEDDDPAYFGRGSATPTDFSVVSIGDSCFSSCFSRNVSGDGNPGCRALVAVKVPDTIKRIGDNAFLRSFFFNELTSYTYNNGYVDSNQYTFPSKLLYIGRSAFACTRLKKALNVPCDVQTFDMISAADIAAQTTPIDFSEIDGTTPKMYTVAENEPRRYSSIFANDWFLDEVRFGEPASSPTAAATMAFDDTLKALYRLQEIKSGPSGSVVDRTKIELLMVCGRLKDYEIDSLASEGDMKVGNTDFSTNKYVDKQDVTIGNTQGYTLKNGTKSIRYGALKMANWAAGIQLNSNMNLFPAKWENGDGDDEPLPQALLTACVNMPVYLDIGHDANDIYYNVQTTSFSITGSDDDFAMSIGVLRNARNITSMEIPANLTEIPAFAFDQAVSIAHWRTPADDETIQDGGETRTPGVLDLRNTSLKYIGSSAFWGMQKTSKVILPATLEVLGKDGEGRSAFEKNGTKQESNTLLTEVDMSRCNSANFTELKKRTFQGHGKLTTVSLPPNITSIGEQCFKYCPISEINLSTLTSLTTIGAEAFYQSAMTTLEIPDSVTTISSAAFQNNTALQILRLPTSLTSNFFTGKVNNTQVYSPFTGDTKLNQVYFSDVTTGKATLKLADSCFPASVKYAMLPDFIDDGNDSLPFLQCTDLKAIFYGRSAPSGTTSITTHGGDDGSKFAPIYYYVENSASVPSDTGLEYWTHPEGQPWLAQILKSDGTVKATYDFRTVLE